MQGCFMRSPAWVAGRFLGITTLLVLLIALVIGCQAYRLGSSLTYAQLAGEMKLDGAPADAPVAALTPATCLDPGHLRQNSEAYNRIEENNFQPAKSVPLSTFALSVDTASFSNVRRFLLEEQRLPPADAVRLAELINYFPYSYPAPTGEHPVSLTVDLTECPWNDAHHLARVAVKGRQLDPAQMPPRNLVFLIDTSGSMDAANRLPLLKQSLKLLVEHLSARDRVALVTYAGSAGLVLPSTPGSDRKKILKALDRLEAGGSTNGGDGITLAYRVARDNFLAGGVNRVILGTDGDFNVGVTSQDDLIRLIEEKKQQGIFLTVLGFGIGNLKDGTLERLAHHGHGHYAYIDSLTESQKIFVEQGGALATIAKDVKLQVEFNPRRVASYRLIGYENKKLSDQDFNDDQKDGGDLGSGHTVTALYEIIPAGPSTRPAIDPLRYQPAVRPSDLSEHREWLTVKLRYKDPASDASKLMLHPLAGSPTRLADTSPDLRFASAVAEWGLLLRQSEHRGTASYARARQRAAEAVGADEKGHRREFLRLVESAEKLSGEPGLAAKPQ